MSEASLYEHLPKDQVLQLEKDNLLVLPGFEGTVLPSIGRMRHEIACSIEGKFREELIRVFHGYRAALPDIVAFEEAERSQSDRYPGSAVFVPVKFNGSRYHTSKGFSENCKDVNILLPNSPADLFNSWYKKVMRVKEKICGKVRYENVGVTHKIPLKPHEEVIVFTRDLLSRLIDELEQTHQRQPAEMFLQTKDIHYVGSQKRAESPQKDSEKTVDFLKRQVKALKEENSRLRNELMMERKFSKRGSVRSLY